MKIYLYITALLLINSSVFGQAKFKSDSVSFDKILSRFEDLASGDFLLFRQVNDSASASCLYKTDDFIISISENPIAFDTLHLVIENPFYKDELVGDYDNCINYPVSYSVIYKDKLVSLFQNGKFVCHNIDSFGRDFNFEKKLNTRDFNYHWIIDNKLGAISKDTVFVWDDTQWLKYSTEFPLSQQPKLFEDSEFIVFGDCHGEWGGTVYFFDKTSGETYFTESTCSNSVIKQDDGYLVLADIGHFMGSTKIKKISDPRKLTRADKAAINKTERGQALGYTDSSNAYKVALNFFGIQLLSTFMYADRQLFMVYSNGITFLAEIVDNEIQIVHPLFDNRIFAHEPITNSYESYILMNLDFYRIAKDREISVVIIKEKRLIKLDWNEKRNR